MLVQQLQLICTAIWNAEMRSEKGKGFSHWRDPPWFFASMLLNFNSNVVCFQLTGCLQKIILNEELEPTFWLCRWFGWILMKLYMQFSYGCIICIVYFCCCHPSLFEGRAGDVKETILVFPFLVRFEFDSPACIADNWIYMRHSIIIACSLSDDVKCIYVQKSQKISTRTLGIKMKILRSNAGWCESGKNIRRSEGKSKSGREREWERRKKLICQIVERAKGSKLQSKNIVKFANWFKVYRVFDVQV